MGEQQDESDSSAFERSRPPSTSFPRLGSDDAEIDRVMALAKDYLGMDVVYVAEFTGGRQEYRELGGAYESFAMVLGEGPALETTYCQQLVEGRLPSVIPDATADSRVRELPITAAGPIGAYVGVPLRFSDGRLFGTFCCLSHQPDHTLDARDGRFMELLASMMVERLESQETQREQHRAVAATLADGDILIALQPIVRVRDGLCCGAEALARFPGLATAPDVAFATAHTVGLGIELELLAMETAIAQLPHVPAPAYLSINFSPAAMLDDGFTATLSAVTEPQRLVVEVTEHASVEAYPALAERLTPLRRAGIRLAVDDVGAGYASFRHVLQLTPDIIKIDRFLVDGISDDPVRQALLRGIVQLARDLGADVVAEGVERHEDLCVLAEIGVDMAQGWLIARPSTDRASIRMWPPTSASAVRQPAGRR